MGKLRKIGANQYEVLLDEQTIGQVWNWHESWAAQVGGKTYYGLKSRKEVIAKVESIHRCGR